MDDPTILTPPSYLYASLSLADPAGYSSIFWSLGEDATRLSKVSCRLCGAQLYSHLDENVEVTCRICGTKNRTTYRQGEWITEDVSDVPEREVRERVEEFARLRNYGFNESKERVIQALLEKRQKFGDFYCPCKSRTVLENVCPCKETRDGSVEARGRCACGLFWRQ